MLLLEGNIPEREGNIPKWIWFSHITLSPNIKVVKFAGLGREVVWRGEDFFSAREVTVGKKGDFTSFQLG